MKDQGVTNVTFVTKKFNYAVGLKRHLSNSSCVKVEGQNHKFELCNKAFKTVAYLKNHINGLKHHKCSICDLSLIHI